MKKYLQKLFCIFIFLIFPVTFASAFSKKDILSPIEGEWNNIQSLVLNNVEDCEVYYSLSGEDPMAQGLAYDGPVILDAEGKIKLRLLVINSRGKKQEFTIDYSVKNEKPETKNFDSYEFINDIFLNPIVTYISGSEFNIPSEMKYSLTNEEPCKTGKKIKVSEENKYEVFLPVTVFYNNAKFHFVLNVRAREHSEFLKKDLPFYFENFDSIIFLDYKNYLYQLDDSYWQGLEIPLLKLDRSKEHTLRIQPLLQNDNTQTVEEYKIPPLPQLISQKLSDDAIKYFLKGDASYTLASLDKKNHIASGQYRSLTLESFDGLDVDEKLNLSLFYDGIYQGTYQRDFVISKSIPSKLEIEKIDGNKNEIAENSLVTDNSNFYLKQDDSSLVSGDGSYSSPFTTFSQLVNAINNTDFVNVHLLSDFKISALDYKIYSDCKINGNGHKLTCDENARLFISNCNVEFENLILEKKNNFNKTGKNNFIIAEKKSFLTLNNCEIAANFNADGTLIYLNNSKIKICETGLSVNAQKYAACLYLKKSSCKINLSRLTCLASSAVAFSSYKSDVVFEENNVRVSGSMIRGLEFIKSKAQVNKNFIEGSKTSNLKNMQAIYKDVNSLVNATENSQSGF